MHPNIQSAQVIAELREEILTLDPRLVQIVNRKLIRASDDGSYKDLSRGKNNYA
jgi:hypothetical protein